MIKTHKLGQVDLEIISDDETGKVTSLQYRCTYCKELIDTPHWNLMTAIVHSSECAYKKLNEANNDDKMDKDLF